MKKIALVYLLTIGFLFVAHQSKAGGPWVLGKKKGFAQIGATFLNYSSVYNSEGVSNGIGFEVTDNTFQLFTEYGISDKMNVKLILPFKSLEAQSGAASESLSGLGNVTIGVKRLLVDKSFKFSGGLDVSMNTIQSESSAGLRTGYDAFGVTPYLSVGTSKGKFYVFAERISLSL